MFLFIPDQTGGNLCDCNEVAELQLVSNSVSCILKMASNLRTLIPGGSSGLPRLPSQMSKLAAAGWKQL